MPVKVITSTRLLWGVIKVNFASPKEWFLLDQSIREKAIDAIKAAEKAFGAPWSDLKNTGFYMVRLRRTPSGSPADIMFAWKENSYVEATGVMRSDYVVETEDKRH